MYQDSRLEPPPEGMNRILACTPATALASLGHVDTGKCPPKAATLQAHVWSAEQAFTTADEGVHVAVVVGFGSDLRARTSAGEKGLIERVNRCVQRNHIRVYERSTTTRNHGLAMLSDEAESHELLPARVPMRPPLMGIENAVEDTSSDRISR